MLDEQSAVQELFEPVEPNWTPQRKQRVAEQVERRLARGPSRRGFRWLAGLATAGATASVIVAGSMWRPGDSALRFDDGSVVTSLSDDGRVERFAIGDPRVGVRILGGAVHFSITPNPSRVFHVDVGGLAVEVLGTTFTVVPAGSRTRVAVERGRVRVRWASGTAILADGQAGTYPPVPGPEVKPELVAAVEPDKPAESIGENATKMGRPPPAANRAAWKSLAQSGRYEEAFVELDRNVQRFGVPSAIDGAESLLLAADTARLSGHPAHAVPHLRELVRRHPRDPRASLAAFTLGVVLLDELGRPRDAGPAFALSRQLAPRGDLVEDAWAREVESLFRSGDRAAARRLAEQYLKLFPSGRRAAFVRRHGGL